MVKDHSDIEKGYSFRLTARVLLYASSHRQESTYHGLCYTSRGALVGTRNSSMGHPMKDRSDDPPHHEQTLLPRHAQRCVREVDRLGGGSLVVWTAYTSNGRSRLVVIQGNMTAPKSTATKCLGRSWCHSSTTMGLAVDLQHDNATPHTAALTRNFRQHAGIPVMAWPSLSADMNPIEHVWDELGRRVRNRVNAPQTLQPLEHALVGEWSRLPVQIFTRLLRSTRKRCRAVYQAQGGHTRYWPGRSHAILTREVTRDTDQGGHTRYWPERSHAILTREVTRDTDQRGHTRYWPGRSHAILTREVTRDTDQRSHAILTREVTRDTDQGGHTRYWPGRSHAILTREVTRDTDQGGHTRYWPGRSHAILTREVTRDTDQRGHTRYWPGRSHAILIREVTRDTDQGGHTRYWPGRSHAIPTREVTRDTDQGGHTRYRPGRSHAILTREVTRDTDQGGHTRYRHCIMRSSEIMWTLIWTPSSTFQTITCYTIKHLDDTLSFGVYFISPIDKCLH